MSATLGGSVAVLAQGPGPGPGIDWQPLGAFDIARTETTVGQFEPAGASGNTARRTRGGSWWYGQAQMRADHLRDKPADTAVVYIGFRCVRSP